MVRKKGGERMVWLRDELRLLRYREKA